MATRQGSSAAIERRTKAVRRPAQEARSTAASGSGWYAALARGGLVAKGVSYGIVGAGVWNGCRGLERTFEKDWRTGRMSGNARKWGGRAGIAGHLARGVVFTLIGIFAVRAAVQFDPQESIGLDGALHKLAAAS